MSVNKTSKFGNTAQLSNNAVSLKFIAEFKDPYLKVPMAWEGVLMSSNAQNMSSQENYDNTCGFETADDVQVSEQGKIPAFYRNSMDDATQQKNHK